MFSCQGFLSGLLIHCDLYLTLVTSCHQVQAGGMFPYEGKHLFSFPERGHLGDFIDDYRGTPAERFALVKKHADKWGRQWIVMPNPTYGSWERALYDYDRSLPARVKQTRKLQALNVWKPETTGQH